MVYYTTVHYITLYHSVFATKRRAQVTAAGRRAVTAILAARCPTAWLPGCLAAWLPGCLAAWLPGCLAAWLPGGLQTLSTRPRCYSRLIFNSSHTNALHTVNSNLRLYRTHARKNTRTCIIRASSMHQHIASRHVTSRRVASRHVASRRVASHHITSHFIASHQTYDLATCAYGTLEHVALCPYVLCCLQTNQTTNKHTSNRNTYNT